MAHGITVTEIEIRPVPVQNGPLRGYARMVLNGAFVVNGMRLIQGKGDLFVSFPREYSKRDGVGHNICYPINRELHEYLSQEILKAYRAKAGGA